MRRITRYLILTSIACALSGILPGTVSRGECAEETQNKFSRARMSLSKIDLTATRLAVEDLATTYPQRYRDGKRYLSRLADMEKAIPKLVERLAAGDEKALSEAATFLALRREALLANPLLDFDKLLVIDHAAGDLVYKYGWVRGRTLPMNYEGNSSLVTTGYDNQIGILSPVRPEGKISTVLRAPERKLITDVDLHFDGEKMLFSMPGDNGRWQIFEVRADGSDLKQLPLIHEPDVDNYDACYLPDENLLFTSSACFTGVPCVAGAHHVANLYRYERAGSSEAGGNIRRLTFDQDHNWCPTLLNDGRVLYTRWEYSDIPHAFSRILFHMNPDGTAQMEYYGSNSYWPTSTFFARPIPNHPTKVVGVIGGHHGQPRMGELVIFDPSLGRREADGVVQKIPGRGKKVKAEMVDMLANQSWPKFLHPYPLSDKYFIVSAKPDEKTDWGVYLVDTFDNMVLLKESKGRALLEPIPLRKTRRPPLIPGKIDTSRRNAMVYINDIYTGDGLKGIPRETVKKLRVFTYHFAYQGMGGQQHRVGLDGPWDVKQVLGTVPVEPDGSASFHVPANTPISLQPLDSEGKALQLMRSWMTAMPGEVLSCVGCHERQGTAPPTKRPLALDRPPSEIEPWLGATRGFSFKREIQPVLDKYCVGCHNGQPRPEGLARPDGLAIPDLRPRPYIVKIGTKYTPSYWELRRFVRTTTIEGDMHLLPAGEYHADTTELVQMLRKGHHNVKMDAEAWERLITWIDLHAPAHGTWHEVMGRAVESQRSRRSEMLARYAVGRDENPEAIVETAGPVAKPVMPQPLANMAAVAVKCADWPHDATEAKRRQNTSGAVSKSIDLGGGLRLDLVRIPAGEFVMGNPHGHSDEQPAAKVVIARDFWMGKFEVTNEQFGRFDSRHDSRIESGDFIQLNERMRGFRVNSPRQPVVRISWQQATRFCQWLSERAGVRFSLPSEAQWEYACRAGTDTPLWYGTANRDFSSRANLADASLQHVERFPDPMEFGFPALCVPPWRPAIASVNDKHRVSAAVGSYAANAWGLHDMHGNVAEWTRSLMKPYPYRENDGRNEYSTSGRRVVRGGSWYDRPKRARSAFRLSYQPYQGVYNVGFRVVCETNNDTPAIAKVKD